jgi:hypothetical protein
MSRVKGHTGEAVVRLELDECRQFAIIRAIQDLAIVRLRVSQAIRRYGAKDLLTPALETIEEVIRKLSDL